MNNTLYIDGKIHGDNVPFMLGMMHPCRLDNVTPEQMEALRDGVERHDYWETFFDVLSTATLTVAGKTYVLEYRDGSLYTVDVAMLRMAA